MVRFRSLSRSLLAVGLGFLFLFGAVAPSASATSRSYASLRDAWRGAYAVRTIQETARIKRSAGWHAVHSRSLLGGRALTTRRAGASLKFRFTGTGIALIGPLGPRRGSFRIILDGHRVATVSAHSARYRAKRVLWSTTFSSSHRHTIVVRAVGTRGHPKVTVDALLRRGGPKATTASSTTPAPDGTVIGSGVSMDGLANTQIGSSNTQGAYSFVPTHSGTLATARFFDQMGSGYGSGDGGQVRVSLRADNGGQPAGSAIWTGSTITMGSSSQVGKLLTVGGKVTAGHRYWLVFAHTGGSGTFSLNCIYVRQPSGELSPRFTAPWTMSYYSGGSWHGRSGYTPVLDLGFADGFHEGNGYMELLYGSGNVAKLGGGSTLTQTFTVSRTGSFTELGIRALLTSGSSPLVAKIQTTSGTTLATASLAASHFASGNSGDYDSNGRGGYGTASLSVTLAPGTYRLVLTSSGTYTAFAIRKGTSFGYDPATISTGRSSTGGSEYDIQWYMR